MEINFTQNFRVTVRAEGHARAAEGGRSTEGRRRPCKQRIRSLREPLSGTWCNFGALDSAWRPCSA